MHDTADFEPVRPPPRRNGIALALVRWRWLDWQRRIVLAMGIAICVAAITAIPNFGWLEATQLLMALCIVRVIARAVEDAPHPLPFHDGTLLAAGGFWTVAVTTVNAMVGADFGTQLLIFGCSAVTAFCGLRIRAAERFEWD